MILFNKKKKKRFKKIYNDELKAIYFRYRNELFQVKIPHTLRRAFSSDLYRILYTV